MAEKTSGQFAGIALFLMIALAAGYAYFVHDWYWNYSAVICTEKMKLNAHPAEYYYVPEPMPNQGQDYIGSSNFWGNDVISEFFANVFALMARWADETIVPWFYNQAAPRWNTFAAEESHRKILAAIVGILYAASVTKVVSLGIEWLHDRVADGSKT